jgi:hypothetical protein
MKAFAMGATIATPITPPTHTKPNKEKKNNNNKRKTTLLELHLNPKACRIVHTHRWHNKVCSYGMMRSRSIM